MAPGKFRAVATVIEAQLFANWISATQYELSPPPTDAVSSIAFAPSSGTKLLVSSWDKKVYCYDIAGGAGETTLVNTYEHRAPVLDVCFGADDNEAFTAGMDWGVNRSVNADECAQDLY
jgi:cell cycle arrest protein BUB3